MDFVDTFAAKVNRIAPTVAELRREGMTRQESVEFRRLFVLRRIPGAGALRDADPIARLISRYDCSEYEFRGLAFYVGEQRPGDWEEILGELGRYVADIDADPIVAARSGEVLRVDHATMHRRKVRTWPCAANTEAFLRALTVCLARKWQDDATERRNAARAVEIAGGPKYTQFWHLAICPLAP